MSTTQRNEGWIFFKSHWETRGIYQADRYNAKHWRSSCLRFVRGNLTEMQEVLQAEKQPPVTWNAHALFVCVLLEVDRWGSVLYFVIYFLRILTAWSRHIQLLYSLLCRWRWDSWARILHRIRCDQLLRVSIVCIRGGAENYAMWLFESLVNTSCFVIAPSKLALSLFELQRC